MPFSVKRHILPISAAVALSLTLSACGSGLSLTTQRTQGYEISQDALAQIRPGQSQQLVVTVLGSPQTTNSFGDETAFYYIQTKVERTAFGMDMIQDRTVLAIYFDKNKKVVDKAVYGAKDGKVIAIQSRKTASFGIDRSFLESLLSSI
jgi:outer membrane protein assembly factor BamE (lipoprotein component of BamABCDE complex)